MPEEIVRELFAAAARAIRGGPLEDLTRLLDPDVEWIPINAALEGTSYRGHAGVRQWTDEMNDQWDDFEALPSEFIDLDNARQLAFGTWRAKGRVSGVQLEAQPAAWLIRFRSGRVVRMQTFTDREEALEAAGLSE